MVFVLQWNTTESCKEPRHSLFKAAGKQRAGSAPTWLSRKLVPWLVSVEHDIACACSPNVCGLCVDSGH